MQIYAEYILLILQLLIVLGIPFICVVISGRYTRWFFRTWFLFVAWYVLLLILNPLFVSVGVELIDGPELFAAVITGWFPGVFISGLGMLVRKLLLKFKPSLLKTKEKEAIINKRDRAEGP